MGEREFGDAMEAARLWAAGEYTGLTDRVAADEFAKLAVALTQDIAVRGHFLTTLYEIREAMGFNKYYPLSNLPGEARQIRADRDALLAALRSLIAKSTDHDGDWSAEWRAALAAVARPR